MTKSVQNGDVYTSSQGVRYKVSDRRHWYAGVVPVGEILDNPNAGVRVILVGAPRKNTDVTPEP